MYTINVKNCNNIVNSSITIYKNKLNIKYGVNGTGKTTLAKAICNNNNALKLSELRSFITDGDPIVNISPEIKNIVVFNEEFVNMFVFVKDEVIPNAFQVFINADDYKKRKKAIDDKLELLHKSIIDNKSVMVLKNMVEITSQNFSWGKTGRLNKKGTFKSVLNKQNIYNIPDDLIVYQEFFHDDNNINWIDWKNKGDIFNKIDKCPYCADKLNDEHKKRNSTFKRTYKKSDAQKLKELCDWLDDVKKYIDSEKYKRLINCIKVEADEAVLNKMMSDFINDVNLLDNKINSILDFGNKDILNNDVKELEKSVIKLLF